MYLHLEQCTDLDPNKKRRKKNKKQNKTKRKITF